MLGVALADEGLYVWCDIGGHAEDVREHDDGRQREYGADLLRDGDGAGDTEAVVHDDDADGGIGERDVNTAGSSEDGERLEATTLEDPRVDLQM